MLADVGKLRDICVALAFEALEGFYLAPLHILENIYNGCGPDWLPEKYRKRMTKYFDFFQSAFLEHDFSFENSDKTRKGFNAANLRLLRNCVRLVESEYSWWKNPIMKARRYFQAGAIYYACQRWGWSAWQD